MLLRLDEYALHTLAVVTSSIERILADIVAITLKAVNSIQIDNLRPVDAYEVSMVLQYLFNPPQPLEGNELTGVDDATTAPSNAYCLSKETTGLARGVGFYTYEGTIPAHRAYLVVAGGPSHARGFLGFGDDDNTTGISLPEAVVIENDGPIYDLSGRRIIGQPQKGIYVKNGKKVVIK